VDITKPLMVELPSQQTMFAPVPLILLRDKRSAWKPKRSSKDMRPGCVKELFAFYFFPVVLVKNVVWLELRRL
jgi:hypothetical protein